MRRRKAKKREINPDFKFGSVLVTRLINCVMKKGKKTIASNIVYKALNLASEKLEKEPVEVLDLAIGNVRPHMQVKSRRVGGATYSVPMEVPYERSVALAVRSIVGSMRERVLKDSVLDLAQVLSDSCNSTGAAMAKKIKSHKEAEANRAFAHYRW